MFFDTPQGEIDNCIYSFVSGFMVVSIVFYIILICIWNELDHLFLCKNGGHRVKLCKYTKCYSYTCDLGCPCEVSGKSHMDSWGWSLHICFHFFQIFCSFQNVIYVYYILSKYTNDLFFLISRSINVSVVVPKVTNKE